MWNLKYDTIEPIYETEGRSTPKVGLFKCTRNRLTDIENRLVVAKGQEVGGGMEWEVGISRCKLLYIEWINNKVLLCSTGNYIQHPMINRNGKE